MFHPILSGIGLFTVVSSSSPRHTVIGSDGQETFFICPVSLQWLAHHWSLSEGNPSIPLDHGDKPSNLAGSHRLRKWSMSHYDIHCKKLW